MQLDDVGFTFEALINSLSFKRILFGTAALLFLTWSWSDILPALNHIAMSIRTAEFHELTSDIKAELGRTIVPFGTTMSKLFLVTTFFMSINRLSDIFMEESYDWDSRVKTLNKKRKRKAKKLESQIELIEQLSATATQIASLSNDFEILADRVERLKLELDKPSKPKPNVEVQAIKRNGELFTKKPNGRTKLPKQSPSERPEF